jgi:hypothetical protein
MGINGLNWTKKALAPRSFQQYRPRDSSDLLGFFLSLLQQTQIFLRSVRTAVIVEHDQLAVETKSLGRNGRECRGDVLMATGSCRSRSGT